MTRRAKGKATAASRTFTKNARPKLFLGSSSDAKPIAQTVARVLEDVADVHPWWSSPVFRPTASTLQGLIDACRDFYDFGLFLLTPDDVTVSRKKKSATPRDNVWFELGLFIGGVGDERTFALDVNLKGVPVKIASDLSGIGISRFKWGDNTDRNLENLKTAIARIKEEIQRNGRHHGSLKLVNSWQFKERPLTLTVELPQAALARHRRRLLDQQLVLVARVEDRSIDVWTDKKIYVGEPRVVTQPIEGDLHLVAPLDKHARGQNVFGRVFLLPPGAKVAGIKTMADLRDLGGLRLDRVGQFLPA